MANSTPLPFNNLGLVQKKDPAHLSPGEHYQLENGWSQQEGAMTVRTGHQRLTTNPIGGPGVSISKLNLGGDDTANPRYIGSDGTIQRGTPSGGYSLTSVYSGLTSGQRWGSVQYNAGTAGTPALYVAGKSAASVGVGALRDNGSYTTLQKWGIDPPPVPVTATPVAPNGIPITAPGSGLSAAYRFVPGYNAVTSGTFEGLKSVSNISNAPGYATITPSPAPSAVNGINGIYTGMSLAIYDLQPMTVSVSGGTTVTPDTGAFNHAWSAGSPVLVNNVLSYIVSVASDGSSMTLGSSVANTTGQTLLVATDIVIVLAVDDTSFYAVLSESHVAANTYLGWWQVQITPIYSTAYAYFEGLSIDAAFNGTADNGYSTDDNFHIGLWSTDITNVTKIEIRICPNFSGTAGTATDYYSYTLVPAAVMSVGSNISPAWVELNIPKNDFVNVGNAGSGAYNWSKINEIDVIATSNSSVAGGGTIGISSIYFVGGGGLNSTAPGTVNYSYLYVYRNPTTGAVGNPCPLMVTNNLPPLVTNGQMSLTLTGTAAAATIANGIGEISGAGSIKIYRQGGSFSDGLYRHIGYVANPGGGETVTYTDNASDQSLDTADTIEFDNDPPVPSSLPHILTCAVSGYGSTPEPTYAASAQAVGGATRASVTNGNVYIILDNNTLPSWWLETSSTAAPLTNIQNIANIITAGSTIQVGFGDTFENSIVQSCGYNYGAGWIYLWLQNNHFQSADAGVNGPYDASDTIEIDSILRGTCDIVHQDFDCVFLAGDTNNPATLYQSKVGTPESFPVVNLELNYAQQINVGSPSNPIKGITSIGPGEILVMNQDNLNIVQIWQGQLQNPIQAPATRGLYEKWCWCKGDNRVWYLAYDGIYAFAGGESQKVSEKIDYLFKKQTVNGIAPIDYTQALKFSFVYAENSLYATVIDTNGVYHRLRFETLYNRWTIETLYAGESGSATNAINGMFVEPDTGNMLVSITTPGDASYLWLADFYSTTDGWVSLPTDGTPIQYTIWRYWPIADPSADYQIGEVLLEMENASDAVTAELFFNYSTTPLNTLAITAGQIPVRNRLFVSINSDETDTVQYSIGLKLTGYTGDGTNSVFYTFQWRNFPWSDSGYPCPKTFSWLEAQVNTNGEEVPFQLQIDGQTAYQFSLTGTFFNRASTLSLPSNLTGIQWRVVPVAGYSGTLQVYGIQPQFQKLPCPLTHWDSLMMIFGYNGFKYIWQVWVDYQCQGPVTFSIYVDNDVLFYQATLPVQLQRGVQRFYLPPVNTPSGASSAVFNKSKSYRFMMDSAPVSAGSFVVGATYIIANLGQPSPTDFTLIGAASNTVGLTFTATNTGAGNGSGTAVASFQFYRDGTRVEVRNLDGDQRSAFEQRLLAEPMQVQA